MDGWMELEFQEEEGRKEGSCKGGGVKTSDNQRCNMKLRGVWRTNEKILRSPPPPLPQPVNRLKAVLTGAF